VCRMSRTIIDGSVSRLELEYLVGTPAGIERRSETHELGLFTQAQMEAAFRAAHLAVERRPKALRTSRVSMRLWPSAQDTAEQSCRPGCATSDDRHGESSEGRAPGVGGFRDVEYFLHRAPQPHDSAGVCVLTPALALPRPWRSAAPRPCRSRAVPLQLHPTAQRVAVRARHQDPCNAGRSGRKRLALSHVFAAFRLTLHVLVVVVDTCAAELPRLSWPHEQRTAA
jgi:hypothetical protein